MKPTTVFRTPVPRFWLPWLGLLLGLSACGGGHPAGSQVSDNAPTESDSPKAPIQLEAGQLRTLILESARKHHPSFDHLAAQSVTEIDLLIQAKAGFEPLPSILAEPDADLRQMYGQVATLVMLNEVIAAQALLRTSDPLSPLSPAGMQLQSLVDSIYTPIDDPQSLEVEEGASADEIAQELEDYARRQSKAVASLRNAHLTGQQRDLALLRVTAGVYHDTNAAAVDAAEAALRATGDDPKTRVAIDKALADAARQ